MAYGSSTGSDTRWPGGGGEVPWGDDAAGQGLDPCLFVKLISDKPFNKAGLRVAIFQNMAFYQEP